MAEPGAAVPADDAEGDLSQGYTIEISCLPDGSYQVSPPEPLQAEAAEEQGEPGSEVGETYTSIGEALKGVLKVIQDNPMTGDVSGDAAMEDGYASR